MTKKIQFALLGIILAAIGADLIWINYRILTQGEALPPIQFIKEEISKTPEATIQPQSQVTEESIEKPAPNTIAQRSEVKEIFIPLGSGSTTANTLTDLNGVEATINLDLYPQIKEAFWEAALSVNGGNGEVIAQLFNVTDKHPVWFSEIRSATGSPQRTTSQKISLEKGEKVYRVQARSMIGAEAKVENARIRIVLL